MVVRSRELAAAEGVGGIRADAPLSLQWPDRREGVVFAPCSREAGSAAVTVIVSTEKALWRVHRVAGNIIPGGVGLRCRSILHLLRPSSSWFLHPRAAKESVLNVMVVEQQAWFVRSVRSRCHVTALDLIHA